jgi:hypothetical protein
VTVTYPPAARIIDVVAIPGAALSRDGRTLTFNAQEGFDFLVQDTPFVVDAKGSGTVGDIEVTGARRK